MNMHYQEYLPSTALKPYVECYWHHVVLEAAELVIKRKMDRDCTRVSFGVQHNSA